MYNDTVIGTLQFNGQTYRFDYVPDFDKLKIYPLPSLEPPHCESESLWPYFVSRLPNRKTAMYKRLLEKFNVTPEQENDLMTLLATVGSKVITDPFVLQAVG